MTTATERKQDSQRALEILENARELLASPSALLLISAEYGKGVTDYFHVAIQRADTYTGQSYLYHLTWAIAKNFGYTLKDKNGRWKLAISGGGYSKPDEIARILASFYGVERIRYEVL